jgi:hypothetical protein
MNCHPERSEGSASCDELQIPRFTRDDKLLIAADSFEGARLQPRRKYRKINGGFLAAEVISEKKSSNSVLHRRRCRGDVIRRHSHRS